MFTEGNVGGISCTKTNSLPRRNWRYAIQDDATRKFSSGILIQENKTKLWKRWIAKQYKDGKLIASYPANKLSEIDFNFFLG